MLETVREFAAERLAELPVHERVRAAHAGAFAALVKDLARPPLWPDRAGLDLLELEHDNFRAALDFYRRRTRPPRCGWPTGSRPSGPRAAISRRDGGGWATLLDLVPDDDIERVDAPGTAPGGSRRIRVTVPRLSPCWMRASNAPGPGMTGSARPPP